LAAALDEVTDPNRAELGPGQPGPAGIGVDLVQLGLGELKHLRSRARRLRPPSPNGPPPYPQQPPLMVKKPRYLLVGTLAATLGVMAGCTFGLAISDDGATSSTAAASPTAQRHCHDGKRTSMGEGDQGPGRSRWRAVHHLGGSSDSLTPQPGGTSSGLTPLTRTPHRAGSSTVRTL
jgi:hypothetical protein